MGIGIEANAEESNKWYKRAADHGDQRYNFFFSFFFFFIFKTDENLI